MCFVVEQSRLIASPDGHRHLPHHPDKTHLTFLEPLDMVPPKLASQTPHRAQPRAHFLVFGRRRRRRRCSFRQRTDSVIDRDRSDIFDLYR